MEKRHEGETATRSRGRRNKRQLHVGTCIDIARTAVAMGRRGEGEHTRDKPPPPPLMPELESAYKFFISMKVTSYVDTYPAFGFDNTRRRQKNINIPSCISSDIPWS